MTDINALRKAVMDTMRKRALSRTEAFREIGIASLTLADFLLERRPTSLKTVFKLQNWVDRHRDGKPNELANDMFNKYHDVFARLAKE